MKMLGTTDKALSCIEGTHIVMVLKVSSPLQVTAPKRVSVCSCRLPDPHLDRWHHSWLHNPSCSSSAGDDTQC